MKPFLRWAGGKNWLVKHINQIIDPTEFNNYHEPFLGGGSIFFHLEMNNQCFLSDLNENLINTYLQIRDNVEAVIESLNGFENNEDFYYEVRNNHYPDPVQRAAQFIYLNQTSFNGIYRVNLQGQYNVPYGHRTKEFLQPDLLINASIKLNGAELRAAQFDENLHQIGENDLIFLDPPYTISHNNNGFIKYNERLFSINDQHRLADFIRQIVERGAFYILTNAAHHEIQNIFNINEPIRINRASLIGGRNAVRGNFEEFIFTNLPYDIFETN